MFFKGKNTTTTASEFAFKVALERVGLREHLHILGQEPHTASDVVGSHSSEEPALGESLRTELGSADLLPASGLMSCPFALLLPQQWNSPWAENLESGHLKSFPFFFFFF